MSCGPTLTACAALLASGAFALAAGRTGARTAGAEHLLGRPAPLLALDHWLDGTVRDIDRLRGRVVLLRWWTDGCPFCAASAPALRTLHERYAERGLVVVGVYHPKPPAAAAETRRRAVAAAALYGFEFPVTVDPDWQALERYWPAREGRSWTSVSFLIDRRGTIRHVHPGGEYHEGGGGAHWPDHASCNQELLELERRIVELLAED